MANISSYPLITPKAGDLLIGSETYDATLAPTAVGNPTRSFTVSSLGATISPIIADGTINKIAMFTSANKVGDSTISSTSGDITIAQNLNIGDSLVVAQDIQAGNDISVSNDLNVSTKIISGQYRLAALNTAPASAVDTGTLGEIRVTADYIYVCTATNTWKRVELATW